MFNDPTILGFAIDANALLVQELNASQLQDNAEAIAAWAASANKLTHVRATARRWTRPAARKFVQAFGRRAFRTTLAASDARVAAYIKLFMAGTSYSDGAQAVISAMLQSPYFLYRSELGTAGGQHLQPDAVRGGDRAGLPADRQHARRHAAGRRRQRRRRQPDADRRWSISRRRGCSRRRRAEQRHRGHGVHDRAGSASIASTRPPTTTPSSRCRSRCATTWTRRSQSLLLEAFNGGGSLGSALTADHTFLNSELATFYGLPTTGLSTAFKSVSLRRVDARDPGLLATGTILNGYARPDTSSPTQRGHMVRSRMLCQDVNPPPPNVDTTFHPSTTPETTRQHFEQQPRDQAPATRCHQFMDWIGFGFEAYDGWGRHRDHRERPADRQQRDRVQRPAGQERDA